jgi:hypothetical protein
VHRPRGGQHQDPQGVTALGQRPADVVTVDAGQVTVEHQHVVVVDADPFHRGVTVIGDVDRHRLRAQPLGDHVGKEAFVFDHEYPHAAIASDPWSSDG